MKKQLLFGHIITIIVGGLIYLLFRTSTLTMFSWLKYFGLSETVNGFRNSTLAFGDKLPDWILLSLPDGLWVFSYVCLMLLVWHNSLNNKTFLWVLFAPLLAISSELGQLLGLIPGTFDIVDLILYLLGMTLPFIFFKNSIKLKLQIL